MLCLLALAFSFQLTLARSLHSLPEDSFAFPKYRVTFLNGLPVLNETAQRWLQHGLRGGELEFLDQPWMQDASSSPREIGTIEHQVTPPHPSDLSLERMKIGPQNSFLCLIPRAVDNTPQTSEDDLEADTTPVRSWSLLQPLSGTCLYHRQGWFTYSYCHNEEIRQFRELLPPSHPYPPGGYRPEEDPGSESYTLGRAPPTPEPGVDLNLADLDAQAANLELARGAGSRYLVQRWGDGTICDKTGKEREVEVQFHCSMTMPDTILFVKEAKTCSYVLVIHTPRLCSEPGFKSRLESREESPIRCREIVDSQPEDQKHLPEADYPYTLPHRKNVLPTAKEGSSAPNGRARGKDQYTDAFKRALDTLLNHKGHDGELPQFVIEGLSADGEVLFELVDELPFSGGEGGEARAGADWLIDALRSAGLDIKDETPKRESDKDEKNDDERTNSQAVDLPEVRDEL
jgi:protein OS-9